MSGYTVIEDPKPQPQDSDVIRRAVRLDGDVCKGAPFFEVVWIMKNIPEGPGLQTHDFDEFVGFMGGDVNAPMELGCVIEFRIGEKIEQIRNTCLIMIPAGIEHGLLSVKNLSKPVLSYSGGPDHTTIRRS
jgi:hypothetical protein